MFISRHKIIDVTNRYNKQTTSKHGECFARWTYAKCTTSDACKAKQTKALKVLFFLLLCVRVIVKLMQSALQTFNKFSNNKSSENTTCNSCYELLQKEKKKKKNKNTIEDSNRKKWDRRQNSAAHADTFNKLITQFCLWNGMAAPINTDCTKRVCGSRIA